MRRLHREFPGEPVKMLDVDTDPRWLVILTKFLALECQEDGVNVVAITSDGGQHLVDSAADLDELIRILKPLIATDVPEDGWRSPPSDPADWWKGEGDG